MKPLTCEMCGSTNLLKQEGVFICQSCGTKYSVEDAKKMMVEGTVAVEGTVKIDTSSELKNLYEVARRAKEMENAESAEKYYDMILVKEPTSWEANFYVVYYRAMRCTIAEICTAANSVANLIPSTVELISKIEDDQERLQALEEVGMRLAGISTLLYGAATNHYNDIDAKIRGKFTQEYLNNVSQATRIEYTFGDVLENKFGDTYAASLCCRSWKGAIAKHVRYLKYQMGERKIMLQYAEKIKKFHPEYKVPPIAACYVATAVYGSYDCPEVWTLRRFRDYTLAKTWYGRAFIGTYYAISPSLVKWFGQSALFKQICLRPLDKLVSRLQEKGVESTPYEDRKF